MAKKQTQTKAKPAKPAKPAKARKPATAAAPAAAEPTKLAVPPDNPDNPDLSPATNRLLDIPEALRRVRTPEGDRKVEEFMAAMKKRPEIRMPEPKPRAQASRVAARRAPTVQKAYPGIAKSKKEMPANKDSTAFKMLSLAMRKEGVTDAQLVSKLGDYGGGYRRPLRQLCARYGKKLTLDLTDPKRGPLYRVA